ncbi:MAG: hypothetical protein IH594_02395, partial [Bacteroidales bacterium]|nr:hypothetical protein [Bacteroidales bacterium]
MKKKNIELSYSNFFIQDGFDEDAEFIPIMSEEEADEMMKLNVPDVLPLLPLKNTVLF